MRSTAFKKFVAVLVIGGFLSGILWRLEALRDHYWVGLFVLAAVVVVAVAWSGPRAGAGKGRFLCDDCKYNDGRYCARPERPNATVCPDYRGR